MYNVFSQYNMLNVNVFFLLATLEGVERRTPRFHSLSCGFAPRLILAVENFANAQFFNILHSALA